MNPGEIYAKTEDGVRELKERKRALPVTHRSLLIMIDGTSTVAEVLGRARALRVDASAFSELERDGLITKRFGAPSATDVGSSASPRSVDDVQRFLDAQQIMSNAINTHLGFRGYLLMMRLQRAENLRDLHDLMPDLTQAITKRVGPDIASALVVDLERLIGGSA